MKEMRTLNGYEIVDAKAREEISAIKENGGGDASDSGGLSEDAVSLLIEILRKATYAEDVSDQITSLSRILGGNTDEPVEPDEPDVPDEPVEPDVPSVKTGTVSFENGTMHLVMYINRATLIPIGQYLEKGKTYKFSLGDIADRYYYGVQIMAAESAGLTFPYVDTELNQYTYYKGVTARIVDSGWMRTEYTYTPDADNCILAVNFKNNDNTAMDESNYTEIFESFVFEEIMQ